MMRSHESSLRLDLQLGLCRVVHRDPFDVAVRSPPVSGQAADLLSVNSRRLA
jgi:hypothetical protein